MQRRVVVTGLGLVTPLGTGVPVTWDRLISGQSGLSSTSQFPPSHPLHAPKLSHAQTGAPDSEVGVSVSSLYKNLPSRVAGFVKYGSAAPGEFDVSKWVLPTDNLKSSPFIHYAYSAAEQALVDADWSPTTDEQRVRTGVCVGSGIGCIDEVAAAAAAYSSKGLKRISPFFVPRTLVNMAAGNISIRYGFMGPNHSVSTACSTGAHSIGDAMRFIQYGDADVMVAGGTESSVSPLAMAGFCKAKSLSTKHNDRPDEASRPFDKDRDGFVIGEGAGIVILEEYEHARRRGAKIYAELAGYGLTGDANHITSPPEDGNGAARAMKRALQVAGLNPQQITYINAHATSTQLGDVAEARAIRSVFDVKESPDLLVSSTKGAIGHLLGAAGAVEAIFTILAVHTNILPPTLNLQEPEYEEAVNSLDLVPLRAREVGSGVHAALTNSFGFGGTNASLCFKKV